MPTSNKYAHIHCQLRESHLKNKRIVLRADCNVPLDNGTILDDFRLKALLPTVHYLTQQHCTITIITHIGRPKNHESDFSTRHLIKWFESKNFKISFAKDPQEAVMQSKTLKNQIILMENVRFFNQEKNHAAQFAQLLAQCGDYFVQDAFGSAHRSDVSIAQLPTAFDVHNRSIGFLVEKEIRSLLELFAKQYQPLLVFCGGNKLETKIPFIKTLIDNGAHVALLPALVFSFLKAMSKEIGRSLIEPDQIESLKNLLHDDNYTSKLLLPKDFLVAESDKNGDLSFCTIDSFNKNTFGISIGPKTIAAWQKEIVNFKSVFFNGAAGFIDRPETLEPVFKLLQIISQHNAYSVVGGGDSVELALKSGAAQNFDFLSTGGGATLAFLANQTMPGLEPFIKQLGKN